MDRFVVRGAVDTESDCSTDTKPLPRRYGMHLSAREVDGRFDSSAQLQLQNLLLRSYAEIGCVRQSFSSISPSFVRQPVNWLDFDSKGVYLASVGDAGCLSIHEFDSMCTAARDPDAADVSRLAIFRTNRKLRSVLWNPLNQDEVACVLAAGTNVLLYDIARVADKPTDILGLKTTQVLGVLTGICFSQSGPSRILASATSGKIHLWDKRVRKTPMVSFGVPSHIVALECIHLASDDQVVYGGGLDGRIYSWDLRGGHSAAFLSSSEVYHPLLGVVDIVAQIKDKRGLQLFCFSNGIGSLALNPANGLQLAFHLCNGWTGILDLATLRVTHLHSPPTRTDPFRNRKGTTWLHTSSVCLVGAPKFSGIYFLDFTSGRNTQCMNTEEADGVEDVDGTVSTSESVVSVAAHPTGDHIVAGTETGNLILIGQKKQCYRGADLAH